jgi:hypothetical protein
MKTLNKQSSRKKECLKLIREFYDLKDKEYNLGYTDLKEPIRHGWYYTVQFSEKLQNIKDYKEIYEFLSSESRSPYTDFWGRTKKEARESFEKRSAEYEVPNIGLVIKYKDYVKLSLSSQKQFTPFEIIEEKFSLRSRGYKKYKKVLFRAKINPKYIKHKYIKCYITKRKNIDPTITSRLEEISSTLNSSKYIRYNPWNIGSGKWRFDDGENFRIRRRRLKRELEKGLIP